MEEEIVYIPKHKKVWLSITKFERYPEMATEGVGRAIGYLAWLVLMFSIVLAVAFMIKFIGIARQGVEFLDRNFNEITYSEGVLTINSVNKNATTDFGNVIVNTEELTEEQQALLLEIATGCDSPDREAIAKESPELSSLLDVGLVVYSSGNNGILKYGSVAALKNVLSERGLSFDPKMKAAELKAFCTENYFKGLCN